MYVFILNVYKGLDNKLCEGGRAHVYLIVDITLGDPNNPHLHNVLSKKVNSKY